MQLPCGKEELLSFDFDRQVEIVCNAFEDDWIKGLSPDARKYAKLVAPQLQRRLLRELILIERDSFRELGAFVQSAPISDSGQDKAETLKASDSQTSVPESEPAVGIQEQQPSHFDRFAITKLLGRGSHGVVYEAEDVAIRRRVALKLSYTTSSGQSSHRAFANEAANASRIAHASIVKILEVGEFRGTHFMVSELIDGENLGSYASTHQLAYVDSASIMADVAAGVEVAHRCGVIHRDLKPANIMLEFVDKENATVRPCPVPASYSPATCRVRILDFGIAKMLDRQTQRTRDGDVVGTPNYMSPEQASGNSSKVDPRSDVFSLGVMLFELLSGRLPFEGPDLVVVSGIRDLKSPSVRSFRPNIPIALEQIVQKCLERNPSNRYASAALLEQDLRGWIAGRKPSAFRDRQRRQLARVSLLVASACALIGIAVLVLGRDWKSNLDKQRFANLGPSSISQNRSGDARDASRAVQPNHLSHLTLWLKQGSPRSLVAWIESQRGDTGAMFGQLDAKRFEQAWDPSQLGRFELARFCISEEHTLGAEDSKRLSRTILDSIQPSEDASWSFIIGQLPSLLIRDLESLLEMDIGSRKRKSLFEALLAGLESRRDLDGLVRILRISRTEELLSVVPSVIRCSKNSESDFKSWIASELDSLDSEVVDGLRKDGVAPWRAKLGLVAGGLEDWTQVDRIISFSTDPRSRSYFIHWFSQSDLPIEPLLRQFCKFKDEWRASAAIACLETIPNQLLTDESLGEYKQLLLELYRNHPSFSVHRAARKLLIAWGYQELVDLADESGDFREIRTDRNWYCNRQGTQMNIIRGPLEFWFGKTGNEMNPGVNHRIEHSFAIADNVVSPSQFAEFASVGLAKRKADAEMKLSWFDAVDYCDWLNRKEGIEDRVSIECLDPDAIQYTETVHGYRLPSIWEWQCLFRAGTKTSFGIGESGDEYASGVFRLEPIQFGTSSARVFEHVRTLTPELTSTTRLIAGSPQNRKSIEVNDLINLMGGCSAYTQSFMLHNEYTIAPVGRAHAYAIRLTRTLP
jgi:serine/threonine protein kinase